jgi:hypothetical protein
MVAFRQGGEIGAMGEMLAKYGENPYWRNQLGCATGTELHELQQLCN